MTQVTLLRRRSRGPIDALFPPRANITCSTSAHPQQATSSLQHGVRACAAYHSSAAVRPGRRPATRPNNIPSFALAVIFDNPQRSRRTIFSQVPEYRHNRSSRNRSPAMRPAWLWRNYFSPRKYGCHSIVDRQTQRLADTARAQQPSANFQTAIEGSTLKCVAG